MHVAICSMHVGLYGVVIFCHLSWEVRLYLLTVIDEPQFRAVS